MKFEAWEGARLLGYVFATDLDGAQQVADRVWTWAKEPLRVCAPKRRGWPRKGRILCPKQV
jgi:hypothetical protein